MAVPAPNLTILQRLINLAVDNSKMEKYILQPTKSVILTALNECKRGQEVPEPSINYFVFIDWVFVMGEGRLYMLYTLIWGISNAFFESGGKCPPLLII